MEVELVTDDVSDDESYSFDDYSEQDYLNLEGERCGICSDIVIDRGVLDCCQHWFCFTCIDNWATITSLCPLCQIEFQLITCVPVYDTVGGNKTDDDTGQRDDDWFIEGKTNTLSFPSYYIDENAVICLDGDSCKIRSGAVAIGEDSDIDTSIACDFCDQWYHAYCVGFEPEGTLEGSWLCPRCITENGLQKPDIIKSYQGSLEISNGDPLTETSFSGRVSVSVADDGETAIVVSLVDQNQGSLKSSESVLGCKKKVECLPHSVSNLPLSEALPDVEPKLGKKDLEFSLSQDYCFGPSNPLSPTQPKICVDGSFEGGPEHLNNEMTDFVDMMTEDHVPGSVELNTKPEDPESAESVEPNKMEVILPENLIADEKETISGLTGFKRKQTDSSDACENPDDGEREDNAEAKFSQKKIKAESSSQPGNLMNQTSTLEESTTVLTRSSSRDRTVKCASEKDKGTSIMDIVQGSEHKSLKQLGRKNSSDMSKRERENAAGLRLKKIMRRGGDDKDSSILVQEIRQKIREAVRNKSSNDISQSLFDTKLLDAFRTAMAGSGSENRKPILDVKAKRALLQKGKVRESLTKKIYGAGGKRRRAWTRECEVEFWKHRCTQATKPEKIQALKSVLDLLKDNSDSGKKISRNDEEPKGSILSRVYLADASVFPRKNDIQPVSAFDSATTEQKGDSNATEKVLAPPSGRNPLKQPSESQVIVCPVEGKDTKTTTKGIKTESSSAVAHRKRDSGRVHSAAPGGTKISSEKSVPNASGDKRKWALELLARKTATSGKNTQDQDNDPVILKGNYPLLAQLPKEMRPILLSARHNKIPVSIRQAQLYRLAEHFLKRANLSTVCRTAETELAIADAANIEKQIADRSNSKIVYVNLCSQEILKKPENADSDQARELNPNPVSGDPCEENNDNSFNPAVDEALKKAGLMSDSPPNSPDPLMEERGIGNETDMVEKTDEEGPDNVFEVDPHTDLDIYGDFEYNLEDDDFIGASSLNVSNQQQEPKIKLLFSSLHISSQQLDGNLDAPNGEVPTDVEAEATDGSSSRLNSVNTTATEDSTAYICGAEDHPVQNSSGHNDEELSLAECEELYGPDKEPLVQMFPQAATVSSLELPVKKESSTRENGGGGPDHEKKLQQPTGDSVESSDPMTSGSKQKQSMKEKMAKSGAKQSESNNEVIKKVEAYIKEHIRPLCKSGVITIEQYRWAVGKTTEKVMKYHAKEKNANFLIKEGEKVKKLAEQYVEAAQQKPKT